MNRQQFEDRAKLFVDAEWAEFMKSLHEYPTYQAWLTGYELPHLAVIKERRRAYDQHQ